MTATPDTRAAPHERSRRRLATSLAGTGADVAALGIADVLSAPAAPAGTGLPVHLTADAVVVGPAPGTSACACCLARRWQLLRDGLDRDALELHGGFAAVAESPYLQGFTLDAVGHVVSWFAGRDTPPTDRHGHPYVYEVRLDTAAIRRHPLVADSDCPRCAAHVVDTAAAATLTLRPARKPGPTTYRTRPASEHDVTTAAYANPVCGAIGTQARRRLDSATIASASGSFPMRGEGYLFTSFWGGHADNYDDSVRLGVFEGLERHAGLRPRRVTTSVTGTYRELRDVAVDPRECGVYTDAFYASSRQYTAYSPDLELPWVWGYSLRDHRAVLVPEALTYYYVTHSRNKFVQECSNGCASGGSMEEAVLYGLLELVERDAFLLGWYGARRLPEIDPLSCRGTSIRATVDRLALRGYDVRLFDNRVDLDVPVVTAVGVRRDGGTGALCFGAGASLDPEAAVAAALCEVAHTVLDIETYTERDYARLRAMAADFDRVRLLQDHPALFALPEMAHHADFLLAGARHPTEMREVYRGWDAVRPDTLDLRDDVGYCVEQVTAAGHDVVVVDQTSPEQLDASLHTACVVAPGLVPIDFGWGQQRALHLPRTRTAFRRAGWRDTDLDDTELHLVPHPFP